MNITTCRLKNDNAAIEVRTPIDKPINVIMIDTFNNAANYKSNINHNHNYAVLTENILGLVTYTPTEIIYEIPAANLGMRRFTEFYIVTSELGPNVLESNVVQSDEFLYAIRFKLMVEIPVPCQDKSAYKRLCELSFRERMYRDAVRLGKVDDAIFFWGKILQMSNMPYIAPQYNKIKTSCNC
jgi:hypothetical protein